MNDQDLNDQAFAYALSLARQKLRPAERTDRPMAALAAAAFFAMTAMIFAACAVLAPANVVMPMAKIGVK